MKVTLKKDVSSNSFSVYPHNMIYDSNSIFFNIVSCGYEEIGKNYYLKRSEFCGNMLTYIIDGTGTFIFKNRTYNLKKDDLIIINCMEEQILYSNEKGMTIYFMHIDSSLLSNFANEIESKSSAVMNFANNPDLLNFFKDTIKKGIDVIDNIEFSKKLYYLLLEIRLKTIEESKSNIQDPEPLRGVLSYIKENYHRMELSLDDIARFANFNKYYLEKLFKKYLNTTVHNYLIRVRLTNARYLLISTNLSISEIAYKCGFTESQVLIKSFKKTYSETPLQYRKNRTMVKI